MLRLAKDSRSEGWKWVVVGRLQMNAGCENDKGLICTVAKVAGGTKERVTHGEGAKHMMPTCHVAPSTAIRDEFAGISDVFADASSFSHS